MNVRIVFVLLTICYSVFCNDSEEVTHADDEYEDTEENRKGKQLIDPFDNKGWKVIDSDRRQNSDDWIPKQSPVPISTEVSETLLPRRRRLKKRKRRPQPTDSDDSIESVQIYHRRRTRPQTLEEINDSWPDIEDEAPDYPRVNFNRRRITPTYASEVPSEFLKSQSSLQLEETSAEKPKRIYEKVRDPFTALQEAETKAKRKKQEHETTTTISSLKALLKQSSGSLNLSEILQQKNLSLSDLIEGKAHAISALTETSGPTTENLNFVTTELKHTSENIIETSDKQKDNVPDSVQLTTIRRVEVITQPTTERRVFVPSHPKYYSTYKYKPNLKTEVQIATTETTSENPTFTTLTLVTRKPALSNKYSDYRAKYVSLKPKVKPSLPVTSAKLNDMISQNTPISIVTSTLPPKAITIDINHLLKTSMSESTTLTNEDGPLKMTINIKHMITKTPIKDSLDTTTDQEKAKPTSARDEIMEVLTDQVSRQNLARILQLRNMTIEELVALRERGSSQLHLADIFHNQTREPEPPNEPYIGHISDIPDTFFNRQAKSLKQGILPTKSVTATTDLKQLNASVVTTMRTTRGKVTNFPTYKIEIDKILRNNKDTPFQISILKSLYPNLYSTENPQPKSEAPSEKPRIEKISDIQRIEEVENTISEILNEQLNVDAKIHSPTKYDDDESTYFKLPTGTKTAIIASGVIVAVSLIIFLTIFIIFKLSQKQKERLCYSNSFSCSRIKTPILEPQTKRTIKTIMCETLGRKKKYTNFYPQSMSDYIWESDRKPFQ